MNPKDWTPDLVIAVIVILCCFTLRVFGINGEVWSVMILAVGWVFGGQFEKRHFQRSIERKTSDYATRE